MMADNTVKFISYLLSAALFCLPCSAARAEGDAAFTFDTGKPVTLPAFTISDARITDETNWSPLDLCKDNKTLESILNALKAAECVALTREQADTMEKSPFVESIFPQTALRCDIKGRDAVELFLTPLYNLAEFMPKGLVRVNANGIEAYVASVELCELLKSLSVPLHEMEDMNNASKVAIKLAGAPDEASCDKSIGDIADALMYCEPVEGYTEVKTLAELRFEVDESAALAYVCAPVVPDGRLFMLWYNELFALDDNDMLNAALKSAGLPEIG